MAKARLNFYCLAGLLLLATVTARTQQPATLTNLQFDIVGMQLTVDPPALTVPKNIPTQINTLLKLPAGAGDEAKEALAELSAKSVIMAELRGPSISPSEITVLPGK